MDCNQSVNRNKSSLTNNDLTNTFQHKILSSNHIPVPSKVIPESLSDNFNDHDNNKTHQLL